MRAKKGGEEENRLKEKELSVSSISVETLSTESMQGKAWNWKIKQSLSRRKEEKKSTETFISNVPRFGRLSFSWKMGHSGDSGCSVVAYEPFDLRYQV